MDDGTTASSNKKIDPWRYIRRKNNGKLAGYSVHPLTMRQQLQALGDNTPPKSIESLGSDKPGLCPIPGEHLDMLYHAFKRHETSLEEAVETEEPFSLQVTGNLQNWVVEIRIIGNTPAQDILERLDFRADGDLWMIYGYEMQLHRHIPGTKTQDILEAVVGTVQINAAE